jgi:hypothetical protein
MQGVDADSLGEGAGIELWGLWRHVSKDCSLTVNAA